MAITSWGSLANALGNSSQSLRTKNSTSTGYGQNDSFASGTASFWKPPSAYDASTGNVDYDISGITTGMNMLKNPIYNASPYSAYKFNSGGKYGTTSQGMLNNVYNNAMNVATRPVIAQGKERMRQATQGWGGGQMSGAAGKELAMKNAMATGSDVADIGKTVGSDLASRMLTQDETARQQEWDRGLDVQKEQAAENFKAAGFSDDQAKAIADEVMKRAAAYINAGQDWLGFQRGVNQDNAALYANADFLNSG